MKFTKRILIMTALAVTAVVSTGFAYDYVCNNSQYNHKQITIPMLSINVMQILNTIVIQTLNTTVIITIQFVTILAKVIAVQTLILEDAADIEDNILNMTEAYSTIFVL